MNRRTLEAFLHRVKSGEELMFSETLEIIERNYRFQPSAFDNGEGTDAIHNTAEQNQGSCRVFAFGRLHDLDEKQTLRCFGEHYRKALTDPEGEDHANIRAFMKSGWSGIRLFGQPLKPRDRVPAH